MSAASEFAPDVVIPERARRSTGRRDARRHLALVPCDATVSGPAVAPFAEGFDKPRIDWVEVVGPAPRPLRLTRRGIVVAVAATVLLCALLLMVARLSVGSAGAPASRSVVGTVTVQPGDTLWSIAEHAAPGHDPRLVVDRIREVNHLASTALSPGQTLKLG